MNDQQAESVLHIRGGRVIDPASGLDEYADILVKGDTIVSIGVVDAPSDARVLDASECLVTPGLIDIHVHFREPGYEHKETIASGAASAINGGFTTVCCMPNTNPPLDSPAALALVEKRAREAGSARVFAVAAATIGRQGEAAGPIMQLADAGAMALSDDGDCIMDAGVMRDVLTLCKAVDKPFMQHCQDVNLTRGAAMNAGPLAMRLGLAGWPRVAEEIIIERDVRLNHDIRCAYHVQHLSSAGSVDIVRRAQRDGLPVSAEASPHHLLLTEDACSEYDTNAKMNPPLRASDDIDAIREGIADGTINILATDHAPHTVEEKSADFEHAPFGIVGLDCALGLYAKALIEAHVIDWPRLISMMTYHPASLVGLAPRGYGSLSVNGPADITIIDPVVEWTIDVNDFQSIARNCPFDGWTLRGRAVSTIVAGRVMLERRRV